MQPPDTEASASKPVLDRTSAGIDLESDHDAYSAHQDPTQSSFGSQVGSGYNLMGDDDEDEDSGDSAADDGEGEDSDLPVIQKT
jgi:hypothetical protein